MTRSKLILFALVMLLNTFGSGPAAAQLTQQDVARLPVARADHRIAYGADPLQFGDLRLPKGNGPHPVAIVIHGGCWLAAFADLQLMAPLSDALARAGIATWNIEFRSVDRSGGGWPNTLLDVASAVDHSRELAAVSARSEPSRHRRPLGRRSPGAMGSGAASPAGEQSAIPKESIVGSRHRGTCRHQ